MKTREFGKLENLKTNRRNFSGGPVESAFQCRGLGFDPWWGN